jgi:hypothetical protein
LICSLSARKYVKRMAEDRLPFPRQRRGADHKIDVETPNDHDLFHFIFHPVTLIGEGYVLIFRQNQTFYKTGQFFLEILFFCLIIG